MGLSHGNIVPALRGFNESNLAGAISFQVVSGYRNKFCSRTMRFSKFLHSKLARWYSRSGHTSAQKLLEEVSGYTTASMSERSRILNKVSILMGYSNIRDLIEQERTQRGSEIDSIGMLDDVDFSVTRARFPCIKLGDSSVVELYDEISCTKSNENNLSPESCTNYNSDRLVAAWQFLGHSFTNLKPLVSTEESSSTTDFYYEEVASSKETNYKSPVTPDEPVLDKPVRCIPGTTSRQCRQLEDSGFHTVRKLLHHFPRTYADLQNAQGSIDDGHYLMFVGTILSSRGIRASSSFSFLEVVVSCELLRIEVPSELKNENFSIEEKKIIYLHLKKFFRGRRFTCQPFLRSIQSKYNEGDHVYVSGKVKKMRIEDHYEMREYNIDMLGEEEERYAQLERRPYPLYPSKAGLKPNFLGDIISSIPARGTRGATHHSF